MIKDRTNELKTVRDEEEENGELHFDTLLRAEIASISSNSIAFTDERQREVANYLSVAEQMNCELESLEAKLEDVKMLQSKIISTPDTDEAANVRLEELMSQMRKHATTIRKKLTALETCLAEMEKERSAYGTGFRICQTQYTCLSTRCAQFVVSMNESQVEFKEQCKNRIKRQLEIVGKEATNEQVDDYMEQGNIKIFLNDDLGQALKTQEMKRTLAQIEARHEQVIKLERSIKELHQLFIDMTLLVETQGNLIDRIESHVKDAARLIETANRSTRRAHVYASKFHKKRLMIRMAIGTLIVIVLIILISSIAATS